MNKASVGKQARKTILVTLGVSVLMFGFGFALVPLYNVFCEITGINGKTGRISASEVSQADIDLNRTVVVQFDSTVNSSLPWHIQPKQTSMEVVPGKLYTTEYLARNLSDQAVIGQAVPSVAPGEASLYFNKTECFCFTEQLLRPAEEKWMPVTFRVSPDIPKDVTVMTLSYTFFNKGNLSPEQLKEGQSIHAGSVTGTAQGGKGDEKATTADQVVFTGQP